MKPDLQRVDELTGLYLDGQASPEEVRELEARLRDHEEARIAFLNGVRLTDGLRLMVEPSAEAPAGGRADSGVEARGRFFRVLAPLAAAAAVLVAVGLFLFQDKPAPSGLPAGTAFVKSVGPGVRLWRGGRELALDVGMVLTLGDRIDTRPGGSVVLSYAEESTELMLGSRSFCQVGLGLDKPRPGVVDHFKRVYLGVGDIQAVVARQTAFEPLVLSTTHGETTVLGTRLRKRSNLALTRLDVEEGLVSLTGTGWSGAVHVAAGHYAVVGDIGDPVAIPAAIDFREFSRLRFRRTDCATLWTNGFEGGLSGLQPVAGSADFTRPLPVLPTDVTIVDAGLGAGSRALRLYAGPATDRAAGVGLELPGEFEGLSLEGQLQALSASGLHRLDLTGLTRPPGVRIRERYRAPAGFGVAADRPRMWKPFRVEYTRDLSTAGADAMDVKGFVDGCLVSWLTLEGDWKGFRPEAQLLVTGGPVVLDNLTLRERGKGRVTGGLLAGYHFDESSGRVLRNHLAGSDALDLTIGNPDHARRFPGALGVTGAARVASPDGDRLLQSWDRTGALSFEFWMAIDETDRSRGLKYAVVDLLMKRGAFNYTQAYDFPLVQPMLRRPRHFVMTMGRERDDVIMMIFTDGRFDSTHRFRGLARELSRGPFAFQIPGGKGYEKDPVIRPWTGDYHFLAIYDRILSLEEVRRNHRCGVPEDASTGPDDLLTGLLP